MFINSILLMMPMCIYCIIQNNNHLNMAYQVCLGRLDYQATEFAIKFHHHQVVRETPSRWLKRLKFQLSLIYAIGFCTYY
jgi:hypothetical protein